MRTPIKATRLIQINNITGKNNVLDGLDRLNIEKERMKEHKKMSIETSKLEVELSTNKQTIIAEQGTGGCRLTMRSSLMIDIKAKIWDDLRAVRQRIARVFII